MFKIDGDRVPTDTEFTEMLILYVIIVIIGFLIGWSTLGSKSNDKDE